MKKERIIAHSDLGLTPELLRTLTAETSKRGFVLREIPVGAKDSSLVGGCEVLFGFFVPELLLSAGNLRWYQSSWAGVDRFSSLEPFASGRALLTSAAGAYDITVSEWMLTTAFMLLRHMGEYRDQQKTHVWNELLPGHSLYGKRVTVLGVGGIGGRFAEMAGLLGARVSGAGRSV